MVNLSEYKARFSGVGGVLVLIATGIFFIWYYSAGDSQDTDIPGPNNNVSVSKKLKVALINIKGLNIIKIFSQPS